jgi:hypothetical protein
MAQEKSVALEKSDFWEKSDFFCPKSCTKLFNEMALNGSGEIRCSGEIRFLFGKNRIPFKNLQSEKINPLL